MLALALSIALAPAPVEWSWEAAPGCAAAAVVERRFERLAPESCRRAQAEPLRVSALASRVDRRWRLDLRLSRGDRSVTRSLTARNCAALVEATAVIAATACPALSEAASELSPETDAAPGPAQPEDDATRVPPPPAVEPAALNLPAASVPTREALARDEIVEALARDEIVARDPSEALAPLATSSPPREPGQPPPGLELGTRWAAAWGPTPAPALIAGGALRVQWPAAELLLALDGGPRRRLGPPSGPGIDLRLLSATIAGCPTLELGQGRRRGRASLCLGLELGALIGAGVGTPITRTLVQPWLAAVLGPSLSWSLHRRVKLGAAVDLAASLTRPAYVLDGYALGFRASATAVRLRMFLAVQLR